MRQPWLLTALCPTLLAVAGLAAYGSSFAGQFLFDDRHHILGPRRLESLWNLRRLLNRRRPVVDWSLALNHVFSGEDPWGYHAVNLSIHVLAGLTLMGLVRRTLVLPRFEGRYDRSARWLAMWVALIWLVHPLHTQAVTYVIQRAELLMGLFYLLTLYAVVRSVDAPRSTRWVVAAVVACALGMASKAVIITAPLVVLLFDRTFLVSSFREAVRVRWPLYLGLVATWSILLVLGVAGGVLDPKVVNASVGFSLKTISPLSYAMTQVGVLVHYLRLSMWPQPLCLDYAWPFAKTVGDVLFPALVIVPLLGVTIWALVRRLAMGFVGAFFFLILAPTSSIVPIKDAVFEHRLYLSLAGVVLMGVLGLHAVGVRWRAGVIVGARRRPTAEVLLGSLVVVVLAMVTSARNRVYQSELGMWGDVRAKCPASSRAARNYGNLLLVEGDKDQALSVLRDGVEISPEVADMHNALGFALVAQHRLDEAILSFREAVRLQPSHPAAGLNLGKALAEQGRPLEAAAAFADVLRWHPTNADVLLEQGNVLVSLGRLPEAIDTYRRLLSLDATNASAWTNLGVAQLNSGDAASAAASLNQALEIRPDSPNALNSLGIALSGQGKTDEAIAAYRRALAVQPTFAGAHFNLGQALLDREDWSGAIEHFRAALQSGPRNAEAVFGLGLALERAGRTADALGAYREVLRIQPSHGLAAQALARLGAEAEHDDAP